MRVEEREKESSGHMCVWMTSVACTIFRAISRRTYTNALLASFYFPRFILQWVYLTKPHHTTHELFLFICALRISLSTDYTYKKLFCLRKHILPYLHELRAAPSGKICDSPGGFLEFWQGSVMSLEGDDTRSQGRALVRHRSLCWF